MCCGVFNFSNLCCTFVTVTLQFGSLMSEASELLLVSPILIISNPDISLKQEIFNLLLWDTRLLDKEKFVWHPLVLRVGWCFGMMQCVVGKRNKIMDILSKHLVKFCAPALLWMSVMRCSGPGPGGQQGAQVSKCCQCDQGAIVPQGDHQPCRHSLPPKHNIEETYRTTHCRPVNIVSFFMFFSSSKVKYPWQIIQHIDRSFNPRKNMEARELILRQASTQCEQTLSSWPHAPIPFVGAQLVGRASPHNHC